MCLSMMDQDFAPTSSTHEIKFWLTREAYTNNPQENMRLPYQILSDTFITDFIWSYDRHI